MNRAGIYVPVDLGHLDWCFERGDTYVKLYQAILRNVAVFSSTSELSVPPDEPGMQHPAATHETIAGVCLVSKAYLAKAARIDARNVARCLKVMEEFELLTVKTGEGRGKSKATEITLLSEAFLVRRSSAGEGRSEQIKRVKDSEEEKDKDMARATQLTLVTSKTLHLQLPLKDGTLFSITEAHVAELEETYKGQVDVDTHLRRAIQWCRDNPDKRKTKRGARKFISGWLSRAATPYRPKSFSGEPEVEVQCESCGAEMDEPTKNGYCDICRKAVGG